MARITVTAYISGGLASGRSGNWRHGICSFSTGELVAARKYDTTHPNYPEESRTFGGLVWRARVRTTLMKALT